MSVKTTDFSLLIYTSVERNSVWDGFALGGFPLADFRWADFRWRTSAGGFPLGGFSLGRFPLADFRWADFSWRISVQVGLSENRRLFL